jgi:Tol biopolymer transport system component
MTLEVGTRIGVYEITGTLGAGAMGEVYRARDIRLKREAAIKVLPEAFASDSERLVRFQREAELLATLNHPNIAGVYGLEEADGVTAIVMEIIDGDTLADRIALGAASTGRGLPVDEALSLAKQIADAIEAAHEKGVIHRDLKPGNIKVTPEGQVKVLDFGLAKLADEGRGGPSSGSSGPRPAQSGSMAPTVAPSLLPTANGHGTVEGVILGTAAYMSPEQARGRRVDRRTDIWAFGCVLFELLSGRQVFERGETVSDAIAAILKNEPDWSMLPADTPAHIRALLRRCLQKDPNKRLPHIGVARLDIEEGPIETPAAPAPPPQRAEPKGNLRVAWTVAAVAAIAAGVLGVVAVRGLRPAAVERVQTRFEITTPPTTEPASFALSPDGRQLAYVATSSGGAQLWVRRLDQWDATPLGGTEGASYPFWSPNGKAIAFFAEGKLKRIDLAGGGAPRALADAVSARGGTWSRDDTILFGPAANNRPLMRVSANGGAATDATKLVSGHGSHRWPQFLPDGHHFLFVASLGQAEARGVYYGDLNGGDPVRVLQDETAAVFAPPGKLLFMRQGALVSLGFDAAKGTTSGEATPVTRGVGEFFANRGSFTVSENGVLAYRAGTGQRRQLVWMDRGGAMAGTIGSPDENALASPELSPDGRRVVVQRIVDGNPDLWVIDVARGVQTRFTFDAREDTLPLWSPDGQRVVFVSTRNGVGDLFEKSTSGAEERPLLTTPVGKAPIAWSPDGRYLLFSMVAQGARGTRDLWALPAGDGQKPFPVAQTPFDEVAGQFSPDGHWLAYVSNQSGRAHVYVRPFPGQGEATQVSTTGGTHPRWRPDGKELFYVAPDGRLMAVPVTITQGRQVLDLGAPIPLFTPRFAIGASITGAKPQYAVARDGRFLVNLDMSEATSSPIKVVLNWDELPQK